MIGVFADTFYWIAVTNNQDLAHEKATSLMRSAPPFTIFTTEEVLTEYLNYFAAWGPHFRRKASTNVQNMRENRMVRIVPQAPASFLAGLELYRSRLDKGYSMTDCVSMQTMQKEGITEALTNDSHFEQEGFRSLLRER